MPSLPPYHNMLVDRGLAWRQLEPCLSTEWSVSVPYWPSMHIQLSLAKGNLPATTQLQTWKRKIADCRLSITRNIHSHGSRLQLPQVLLYSFQLASRTTINTASATGGAGTVVIVSGLLPVRHGILVEPWMP